MSEKQSLSTEGFALECEGVCITYGFLEEACHDMSGCQCENRVDVGKPSSVHKAAFRDGKLQDTATDRGSGVQ